MQKVDFSPYVGPAFRALREHGCTAVRGFSSKRAHCGYDETAWSKPLIVAYGVTLDVAEHTLRDLGWLHDVKVQ